MKIGLQALLELDSTTVGMVVQSFTRSNPCRVIGRTVFPVNVSIATEGIEPVSYGQSTAWILRGEVRRPGLVILKLSPSGEGDALHCHPKNDRILWILSGEGQFRYIQDDEEVVRDICSPYQVFMVRGTPHTMKGPITCLAMPNPFLPLGDPGNYQLYEP